MRTPKEIRAAIDAARAEGWTVEPTKNNSHIKMISPSGRVVFISGSPSDHRAMKNALGDLRRAGLTTG